jgi:hypothetical protein
MRHLKRAVTIPRRRLGRDELRSAQRILGTTFEEIVVDGEGVSELAPREGWRPYLRAALATPRVLSERKTGLEAAKRTFALVRQSTDHVTLLRSAM